MSAISSASVSAQSTYLSQQTGLSQQAGGGEQVAGQRQGPPPPPRSGGAGGPSGAGAELRSALEAQGLSDSDLEAIRSEIESSQATGADVLATLEAYGVDTEQLAADLADLSDQATDAEALGEQSPSRFDAAKAVLEALFAFDAEA